MISRVVWLVAAVACSGTETKPAQPPKSATCTGCYADTNNTASCATHSVSPCRWVLRAPEDPIDLVTTCDPSCCATTAIPELCPDYVEEPTLVTGDPCPQSTVAGASSGQVTWSHPGERPTGFVLAQAHGRVTSASELSGLVDAEGHWQIQDVPTGDVTFSFYRDSRRTRVHCTIAP